MDGVGARRRNGRAVEVHPDHLGGISADGEGEQPVAAVEIEEGAARRAAPGGTRTAAVMAATIAPLTCEKTVGGKRSRTPSASTCSQSGPKSRLNESVPTGRLASR